MLTISLDEAGAFEHRNGRGISNPNHAPNLVGGVIFDDHGDPNEARREKKRIAAYYQTLCENLSTADCVISCPEDLHCSYSGSNSRHVKKVKQEVSRTLSEFLQEGTYNGQNLVCYDSRTNRKVSLPERKGTYLIYTIFHTKRGVTRRKEIGRNEFLVRDSCISNRYQSMIEQVLDRLVLQKEGIYAPTVDNSHISIDFATRSVNTDETGNPQDYREAGFYTDDSHGTNLVSVSNDRTVHDYLRARTIDDEVTWQPDIEQDLSSISYNKENMLRQGFLYLADSLCSYLTFDLKTTGDDRLTEIEQRLENLLPKARTILLCYDDVDELYENAMDAWREEDLYRCLGIIYETQQEEGAAAKLYEKRWFRNLLDLIRENAAEDALHDAVDALSEDVDSAGLHPSRSLFAYEVIRDAVESRKLFRGDGRTLYRLYDAGWSVYSRCGMEQEAEQCQKKAEKYRGTASIEERILEMCKTAGHYENLLDFDKAQKQAQEAMALAEVIQDVFAVSSDVKPATPNICYGIAWSELGKVYSYQHDTQAENCFRKALEQMTLDEDKRRVVQSYLLHYYIEMGLVADHRKDPEMLEAYREKYETCFTDYIGMDRDAYRTEKKVELYDAFRLIVEEGAVSKTDSPRFALGDALYVFCKAWYVFYRTQKLGHMKAVLEDIRGQIHMLAPEEHLNQYDHPYELISKNLALLCIQHQKKEAEDYLVRADRVGISGREVLHRIARFGRIECLNKQKRTEEAQKQIRALYEELCAEKLAGFEPGASQELMWEKLRKAFTYMHH